MPFFGLKQYTQLSSEMSQIYSTTKICSYEVADRCNLALEPGRNYFKKIALE
jgi:hypothetical protein